MITRIKFNRQLLTFEMKLRKYCYLWHIGFSFPDPRSSNITKSRNIMQKHDYSAYLKASGAWLKLQKDKLERTIYHWIINIEDQTIKCVGILSLNKNKSCSFQFFFVRIKVGYSWFALSVQAGRYYNMYSIKVVAFQTFHFWENQE